MFPQDEVLKWLLGGLGTIVIGIIGYAISDFKNRIDTHIAESNERALRLLQLESDVKNLTNDMSEIKVAQANISTNLRNIDITLATISTDLRNLDRNVEKRRDHRG